MASKRKSEAYGILCLFLTSGHTFTFRNVVVQSNNETTITFTYRAMSDGFVKSATFYKQNVAGVSFLLG
jgi:hypothetical protein